MAKGTDSEEFVLMSDSDSRSGLKRELGLVLNVQAQLPNSSLNRKNTHSSNGILEYYTRKRFKKSGGSELSNKDASKSLSNDSVKISTSCEYVSQHKAEKSSIIVEAKDNVLIAPTEGVEIRDLHASQMNGENAESNFSIVPCVVESQSDLVLSPTLVEPESNVEKVKSEKVPHMQVTQSALQSEDVCMAVDDGMTIKEAKTFDAEAPRELIVCLRSPFAIEETSGLKIQSDRKPRRQFRQSALKPKGEQIVVDGSRQTPIVLAEQSLKQITSPDLEYESRNKDVRIDIESPFRIGAGNEARDASAHKPRKRFTRSALKFTAEPVIIDDTEEEIKDLESELGIVATDANGGLQNTSPDKSATQLTCTYLESKVEPILVDNKRDSEDASSVKHPRRFSRIALECMTKPQAMDEYKKVKNSLLKTPLRRFTRSVLECKKELELTDENNNTQNTMSDTPQKHFTRSTSNTNDNSVGLLPKDTCGLIFSPTRTPQHKKFEMKMSKKIALTKIPTKITELLETGMLEGLSIRYMSRAQQTVLLRGMIKDCGILCSCTLCKGCKVVTPNEFERHAGSTNKNPPNYLFLDNGNSLRDVLNACKDVPSDMWEAAIQTAIDSPSARNAICLNCKEPLPVPRTRRMLVLCNSCLESKKSQRSSAGTDLTVARSKPLGTPKSFDDVSKSISPHSRSSHGKITRKSKPLATPKSFDDVSKSISPHSRSSHGKITRKDLRLHKLVFEEDGLPDGTELAYYVQGKKLLEGYKKGVGIFCFCCNNEVSPSQFEAHAGWATRRKPYLHIYTSNGVSLHELSISLSKGRKFSATDNDDLCGICGDFGDLLLCDACPRAYHKDCVGEPSVPRGKWYCPYCQIMFQRDQASAHNANALAAGRVSGVDPIEQISKRCIRIISSTPETEVGGCTLCRIPGFSKSGFGPRTIIICDQCEKEYHVGCLRDHGMGDLKELPEGKWFCCKDCSRINSALQKCILRGPEELPDSITKLIKMNSEETNNKLDISWRLLSGKLASPESRSLLSKAVAIFHNRFDPIVDSVTGRDLIPCMVYGRSIREQEFGGMFCAVLTVNSSVVSAGLLRILGQELAELPLVATSSDYQGQGYFQSLFSCIERLLGFLNVKNLVLPAAEEAEAIWTKKFGFQKVSHDQMTKYTKDYQMTVFRGTPILYKPVRKCRMIGRTTDDS